MKVSKIFEKYNYMFLLSGIFLRLLTWATSRTFWSDEMAALFYARLPIMEGLKRDHAKLFSLLLRLWDVISPNTELALHVLPLTFSIMTIFYVHIRWKNPLFTLFICLNSASISFAGELKSGSLFELLSLLFMGQASRLYETIQLDPRPQIDARHIFSLVVIVALLFFTNPISLLFVIAFFCVCLIRSKLDHQNKIQAAASLITLIAATFFIFHNYIKLPYLIWMKNYPSESIWYKMYFPLYEISSHSHTWFILSTVLMAYVWIRIKTLANLWMIFLTLAYLAAILYSDLNLGFRRFSVPLNVVANLAWAEALIYVYARKNIFYFLLILSTLVQLRATAWEIHLNKSSWAMAAKNWCSKTIDAPSYFFGHEGLVYYINEGCARRKSPLQNFENKSYWLLAKDTESAFRDELHEKYKNNFILQKIADYDKDSNEPVYAFLLVLAKQ